jgi:radical SAM family protein
MIQNRYLEINAAEQCNLTCRSCSHLAPLAVKTFADPDVVFRDLRLLASIYHARSIKLVGGEPLLHPDLASVAAAARRSGICDGICVVTNGVLLPRMNEAFWSAIDEVWVSVYPTHELDPGASAEVAARAREHKVGLRFQAYDKFRESYSAIGTRDAHLTARIYRTCRVAHVWRCHVVCGGYFYKCPQSYFLTKTHGEPVGADGIAIDDRATLGAELRAYLASPESLTACRRCLGTVGRRFAHEEVPRRGWAQPQQRPAEDLVDYALLEAEEARARIWRTLGPR